MHELSIVTELVEQVCKEVRLRGHSGRVKRVELTVGRLSGVHCDSIRFAFDLLRSGTPLDATELRIRQVRAKCACDACGARSEIDRFALECPVCSATDVRVEGGEDLILESIELEDCEEHPVGQ